MTKYVVGFVFSADFRRVLLIRKKRPSWQAGRLNGIGGHIEPDEMPVDAMSRECWEESQISIPSAEWRMAAFLVLPDAALSVYFASTDIDVARTRTDEAVTIHDVEDILHYSDGTIMPNLRWLIPFCIYCDSSLNGSRIQLPIFIREI